MQFNQGEDVPKRSHVLNHPRADELLSRLFHFLPLLLLLPLIIAKSSAAADLSCFYIKHNTHTETDVLFFHARHTTDTPPPTTHPSSHRPNPAGIQEKADIMRNWDGHREPLLPLLVLVLLSFALRPPARLLHLVCITSHFHLTSLHVGSKAVR